MIKIAKISFAFNNSEIIRLLQRRGNLISNACYKEIHHIDDLINKVVQKKFDLLIRPV